MSIDDYEDYYPDWEEHPRDAVIDTAKGVLMEELFDSNPSGVLYERQFEIKFERRFFHWITSKAL